MEEHAIMVRIEDLTETDLNWLVGAIEMESGLVDRGRPAHKFAFDPERHANEHGTPDDMYQYVYYEPCSSYSTGGPIMDRWRIGTNWVLGAWTATLTEYGVSAPQGSTPLTETLQYSGHGPTRLLAAMRCLVQCHYGAQVAFPLHLAHCRTNVMHV